MPKLTEEQRQRMIAAGVDLPDNEPIERGWTNDQIKEAVKQQGFTLAELEIASNLPKRSLYQSLQRRYPKADKMLAAFIGVHESVIWPNRYFVNGTLIDSSYNIEFRSDEELAKLNAEVSKPRKITVIRSWAEGDRYEYEPPSPKQPTVVDGVKNSDGTVNHPFYDQPIHEDVSPMADQRQTVVTLPVGMNLDVK